MVAMEGFKLLKFIYLMDDIIITRTINHLYPPEITGKLKKLKIVKVLYSVMATSRKLMRDLLSD